LFDAGENRPLPGRDVGLLARSDKKINFPDYAGTFYVKVPGSGGQAAILVCHN
jgi:hypothetical protein